MSITNEKLQIIKDNVSKVYRSGQMDVIKNANSLKGFESNKAILLDDVSPVTHDMGVKVRSKNMFEGTLNSGIYENENFKISIADSTKYKSMKIYLPVGTYTLASSVSLMLVREVVDGVYGSIAKSGNTYTFSVTVDGDVGFSFRRSDDADWDDSDNVWLNEGSTAAEYTPYVPDLTAVKVRRCGKNIFDKSIPYSDSNHYISIGGGYKKFKLYVGIGTAITVSLSKKYTAEDGKLGNVCVYPNQTLDTGGKWLFLQNNAIYNSKEANIISTDGYISLKIDFGAYDSFKDELQIEIGTTATYYEPYITPTDYTPTADGTVNGVTSLYPNTTLTTDTEGVLIDCEYYKDVDKAYNKLSAEIALSGGE